MTVEEAKTKYCPETFECMAWSFDSDKGRYPSLQEYLCKADQCMAWRWIYETDLKSRHGYCGRCKNNDAL